MYELAPEHGNPAVQRASCWSYARKTAPSPADIDAYPPTNYPGRQVDAVFEIFRLTVYPASVNRFITTAAGSRFTKRSRDREQPVALEKPWLTRRGREEATPRIARRRRCLRGGCPRSALFDAEISAT